MTDTKTLTKADLIQFTGSEHWYRIVTRWCATFCTPTASSMSLRQPAPLAVNEITFAQRFDKLLAAEEFQSWKLTFNSDHTATLTCEDGNGGVVFTKAIEFSDFPLAEITLYFINNTILLPSEY